MIFIIFIYGLIRYTIYSRNFMTIKILVTSIFIIHLCSFALMILINPGIPNRKYYYKNFIGKIGKNDEEKYDKCEICNIITPKEIYASHCYYCKVCVLNSDHHCTFYGKCIAKNNRILFYISIITIPFFILICLVTLIGYVIFVEEEYMSSRRNKKI